MDMPTIVAAYNTARGLESDDDDYVSYTDDIQGQDVDFYIEYLEGGNTFTVCSAGCDYATFYLLTQGHTPACGDTYTFSSAVTDTEALDLSATDCPPPASPITINLGGYTWTVSGGLTLGDYWILHGEGGVLVGPLVVGTHHTRDRILLIP